MRCAALPRGFRRAAVSANCGGSAAARRRLSTSTPSQRRVVLVDGVRIPFALSSTFYDDVLAVDLARASLTGLVTKTGVSPNAIDYVLFGTVVQEPRTSNIAREAAMHAGLPRDVPAHTVTMACVSANAAICQGAEKIVSGHADVVIAGGCETFSDAPIRYSRPVRKKLIGAKNAMKKGVVKGAVTLTKGLKLKDLAPEAPQIANYTTGEVMGHSSDRLSTKFGVSRGDQDAYCMRSHALAHKAHVDGLYENELVPGPSFSNNTPTTTNGTAVIIPENGIRVSTPEQLAKLKPAFVKGPEGTHTAANSSFLTDGAAAVLIMEETVALKLGYTPKAILKDFTFAAVDPFEELLLGPTYATSKLLLKHGLSLENDVDVIEMHEAFAGQVLSNFTAMGSDTFARDNLPGRETKVGDIDIDKVNARGGSLSLGHPFGATGARLVTTAANRLIKEDKTLALVTACADGGIGHACLLERYDK